MTNLQYIEIISTTSLRAITNSNQQRESKSGKGMMMKNVVLLLNSSANMID